MCKTFSSFEQLGQVMKDMPKVESSIFDVLSNKQSSETAKKKAMEDLATKIGHILPCLEAKDFLYGINESISDYNDYCRNLAAYLLMCPNGDKSARVFAVLEMLLENMAPTFKTELRSLKKAMSENGMINQFGFSWADLKLPFFADKFAVLFCKTIVSAQAIPQVVYVDREIIKEVVKEVVIEKEKIVEKIVEVRPKEDPDFFGEETQHIELKSSFMEKPKTAKYDNQRIEICRKLCGFLNSDGGTLYIGVDPVTKRAYPKQVGKEYYGVEKDLRVWLTNYTVYQRPINDIATYCDFVKQQIHRIFQASNPETVSLFINQCIHVQPSKRNDNVAEITVLPSQYCIVYLNSVAYLRDGEECKEMDDDEILVRRQQLKNISKEVRLYDKLEKAVREHKQAILYRYASANSKTVSDRRVEPFEFVCNGESIMCYDMDKKAIRQFKLSRVSDVRVLKDEWKYGDQHVKAKTDVFDWTDMGVQYHICLDMGLRAMTNFCDIYANAKKEMFEHVGNGIYRLDTIVYSLIPVKSFFLSMADEITIQDTEDSEELHRAIREFVLQYVM